MPELPDVTIYVERLNALVGGQPLEGLRISSPFLLRTAVPPWQDAVGKTVREARRLGKRIVLALDGDLFLVLHLMIAGRLRWKPAGAKVPGRVGLAAFDFPSGTLVLTEASKQKRASLHVVAGEAGLAEHDRGGLEVLDADLDAFVARLRSRNHTLKRALTDPRLFSGIGNAYSDEILHRGGFSPFKHSQKLSDDEAARLHAVIREVLEEWLARFRAEVGDGFPDKVTAFRDEMAVHGKYDQPCPVCGSPVQRIRYAGNEANYCASCQTGGKLLADRALSRLLKDDWPKTLEELEAGKARRRKGSR